MTLLAARQNVRAMRTVLLLVLSVSALSACGLRGELVRPEPMWGNPPNEGPLDPRSIRAAEEAARAASEADQSQPAPPPQSSTPQ